MAERPAASDAFRSYLGEIAPHVTLAREDEAELAERIARALRARSELLLGLPFVARHLVERARRLAARGSDVSPLVDDVVLAADPDARGRVAAALERARGLLEEASAGAHAAGPLEAELRAALAPAPVAERAVERAWHRLVRRVLTGPEDAALEREVGLPLAVLHERMDAVQRLRAEAVRARHTFVEHNLKLVVVLARRFEGMGVPLADLVQEGNLGLMRAVDKFDPGRGVRFSTYAAWWIRQALIRTVQEQSRTVRLSRRTHDRLRQVERLLGELGARLGRSPAREELCGALGLDERRADELLGLRAPTLSLQAPVRESEGDERTLEERLGDPSTVHPVDSIDRARSWPVVRELLDTLDERERAVLRWRYGLAPDDEPLTLRQVGERLCISHERARQIEARALSKLRKRTTQCLHAPRARR